ncbi:MAG: AAA family ATPase [Candidatus Competibacteraceae bacterium]|nr:AAA family ATPase [Candidatus Competibacteraceae bacterium]
MNIDCIDHGFSFRVDCDIVYHTAMRDAMPPSNKLRADEVRFSVTDSEVEPYLLADSPPADMGAIIGQDRALRALKLGTEIRAKGYNIFVTGLPGTGKQTTVMKLLRDLPMDGLRLTDVLYVYNFARPESPSLLYLPPGEGQRFKKALHQLVENLKALIRTKLAGGSYGEQRDRLLSQVDAEEAAVYGDFEQRLMERGLAIVQMEEEGTQTTDIMPVVDGATTDFDELQARVARGDFSEARFAELREAYYRSMEEMKAVFQELRRKRATTEEELEALRSQVVEMDVQVEVDHLRSSFDYRGVATYLDGLREDILHNLYIFQRKTRRGTPPAARPSSATASTFW